MSEFEQLTQTIFDHLNIKVLTVRDVRSELTTPEFFDRIKDCCSLRSVNFDELEDPQTQLDIIEANLNVRACTIDFRYDTITERLVERVQKMLSDRSDNSLFVYSYGGILNDIPQITQQFRVFPASFC